MSEQGSEQRLEKIETKLLAAEDQLEALNRIVWRQQEELALLREQCRQLAIHIKEQGAGPSLRAEDEIPPHW